MTAGQGSRLSLNSNNAADDASRITTFAISWFLKVSREVTDSFLKRSYPFDALAFMSISMPQVFKLAVHNDMLVLLAFLLQLNEFVGG